MGTMNDEAIQKATGRPGAEWFTLIREAGKADAPHKEIADYLQEARGVSPWWAQEITVEFEKHAGRRVLGQTQDGLFQLGVSKTIDAPAPEVWACLSSPWGISLVVGAEAGAPAGKEAAGKEAARRATAPGMAAPGRDAALPPGLQSLEHLDGESLLGVRASTTTFAPGSHVRIRWQRLAWPGHSILQIRVTPKGNGKSVLSFHQEKLPSLEDRRELTERWRHVAEAIARGCQAAS